MSEHIDDLDTLHIARRAATALSSAKRRDEYERINRFVPYPKQAAFINCPAQAAYFKCGNQLHGKSTAAAAFVTYHALGRLPADYAGWRQPKLKLERPYSLVVWIIAPTAQMSRDGMQLRLFGDVAGGRAGTALVPLDSIVLFQNSRGIAGALDSAVIRRDDSTQAVIRFKSAEQGRDAMQAESVDIVIADEMISDMSIWNELLARLALTQGVIRLCATPLRQQSPVAQWFKEPGHSERAIITASGDDATHLSAAERAAIMGRYSSAIELNTRFHGLDWQGGGSVYTVLASEIAEDRDPATFPTYWKNLIAVDLSHGGRSESASPFAAVFCAYDPIGRVLRIFDAWKISRALPEQHVAKIMQSPIFDAPVAWGHDGNQATVTGETYAAIYKHLGLRMLASHATFESGGYAIEPGLDLVEQWLAQGRLKVAKHLTEWFTEYGMYERDEAGKPIKRNDHLMDATRLAVMSVRFAKALDPDRPAPGLYRGYDPSDPHAFRRKRAKVTMARGIDDWDVFTGKPYGD